MSSDQQLEEPIEIFFLHVSEDRAIREDLQKHLWQPMRKGLISWWYEEMLLPGHSKDWETQAHLERSDICIVLVSSDFVASDYCDGSEMKLAMQRYHAGKMSVIPVIARAVDWKDTPFSGLQELPKHKRPIKSCPNYDEALKEVADGIREVIYTRVSSLSSHYERSNKNFTPATDLPGRLPTYDTLASEIRILPQGPSRFREEVIQRSFKPTFTKTFEIFKFINTIAGDYNGPRNLDTERG